MATDIRVPALGESVTEATIGQWFKKVGDTVAADEPVVELETDKVTIEVPAPSAGVLQAISANPGDTVNVGALIGAIGDAGAAAATKPAEAPKPAPAPAFKPEPAPPAPAAAMARAAARPIGAEDPGRERPCRLRRQWVGPSRPGPEGRRAGRAQDARSAGGQRHVRLGRNQSGARRARRRSAQGCTGRPGFCACRPGGRAARSRRPG